MEYGTGELAARAGPPLPRTRPAQGTYQLSAICRLYSCILYSVQGEHPAPMRWSDLIVNRSWESGGEGGQWRLAAPWQSRGPGPQFEMTPPCHFHTDVRRLFRDYILVKSLHVRYTQISD